MIKCIVWDLDETIWTGTLAEGDRPKIRTDVLEALEELDKRGILHSIASRNDPDQAVYWLKYFDLEHLFLYPQIGQFSKAESVLKIAQALNISTGHIAFVDDNEFERYEVSQFLPEVTVIKADEIATIGSWPEFSSLPLTEEAKKRRQMMHARQRRIAEEERFVGSREDFLKSCHMVLTVRPGGDSDLDRAYELASRTNQLNNLLVRPSKEVIYQYLAMPDKMMYVANLEDRFGDHGIVGVCLLSNSASRMAIDLFCISCRVEGRGIAQGFLGRVLENVYENYGISVVECLYKNDPRNRSALILLQLLGFRKEKDNEKTRQYVINLPLQGKSISWLTIR